MAEETKRIFFDLFFFSAERMERYGAFGGFGQFQSVLSSSSFNIYDLKNPFLIQPLYA